MTPEIYTRGRQGVAAVCGLALVLMYQGGNITPICGLIWGPNCGTELRNAAAPLPRTPMKSQISAQLPASLLLSLLLGSAVHAQTATPPAPQYPALPSETPAEFKNPAPGFNYVKR